MEELINFSDEKLVMLYANGLNKAFDILVERYKNKVYSYIFHIVKCEDLADDIFQETFVKAIVTINQRRYTENGKFLPWIMRIAHNLIIDFYRQEKSENTQSCDSEQVNILNRKDLADSEQIEIDIIKEFLPAIPTKSDIENYINTNYPNKIEKKMMGVVVKEIKEKLVGADGKLVADVVKENLI
jgi:RNA polymerase sigma-70 factor (ECF subfamily)